MVRKRMIVLAAAAFIGGMSFTPSIAAADWYGMVTAETSVPIGRTCKPTALIFGGIAETCGGIGAILVVI
jgi:hypothetical protein